MNCRNIGDPEDQAQRQLRAQELSRANAQLEEFAYAVAHDLKEPLRTISAFTEILVRDKSLGADGKLLAKHIIEGVQRMSDLFEGLHAFAVRGFDDSLETFELGSVVAEALKNLGHASNAAITVDPLPAVQGFERPLVRVFQNLIANAIKYRSEAPLAIHVGAQRMGATWTIRVQDNGIGVPVEHRESIFTLLKRLHGPEIPGAGIGLAICKKIVHAMGGVIWVESEPGFGSSFCFTVAAAKDASRDWSEADATQTLAQRMEASFAGYSTQSPGMQRATNGH